MPGRHRQAGPVVTQSVSNSSGVINQFANVEGDVIISGQSPRFGFRPFAPAAKRLAVAQAREMPSKLLHAAQETVTFTGREAELAGLSAWRDRAGACSVRLIHGPGGQGKSRLLAHFARECAEGGWPAWQARLAPGDSGQAELGLPATAPGLLVAVDYAERWPVDDLLALVETLVPAGRPVRVLLAARPAGRWWISVRAGLRELSVPADGIGLPPLGQQVDRSGLFAAARDEFAVALGVGVGDVADIAPPAAIDQAEYESVLTVHMAALAAVSARIDGGQAPADPAGISAYLLDRERTQWRKLHERHAVLTTEPVMGRAVFTAILTRPVSDRIGTQALIRGRVASMVENARQILDDHGFCYPPADVATVLEPLYPDRLGEDYLALETPGSGFDDYADPWAADAVGSLLAFEEGTDPPPWARAAMTALAGAAERWPHLQCLLADLLRGAPQLAKEVGGSAMAAIADFPCVDPEILEAIERQFPEGGNLDLDIGIAAVTARLTAHRLEATDKPEEQAALMFPLATRLENAGDRQGALEAVSFAADTYGELADHDPDAYQPELARALIELGKLTGDRRVCVQATEAAAQIYQRLVADHPGQYQPYLARALNNLGNHHPERSTARKAAEDAVGIYEQLVRADPAAYEDEYATALANLAHHLAVAGQTSQALTTADSALRISRRLAEADPAAHTSQLAMVLNNLGMLADTAERRLASASEAAQLYRGLAAANPVKYDLPLAMALGNLSLRYSDLKRGADALTASGEAVTVYQRLAGTDLVRYEPRLARQLLRFARLSVAERAELPAAEEAVEQALSICQRMPVTQPGLLFTDLEAQCRSVKADVLDALGRTQEAARIR